MNEEYSGLYKTTIELWTSHPVGRGQLQRDLDQWSTPAGSRMVIHPSALVPCLPHAADNGAEAGDALVGRVALLLLCDWCYEVTTGQEGECQPGCQHGDLEHAGSCLWLEGPSRCQWCGVTDRLTPVVRDHDGLRRLPDVQELDEGLWSLVWDHEQQGPYPSAEAAWDGWHATRNEPSGTRTWRVGGTSA